MKAYIMGNYTEKAFQGFIKDPTSDRKAVVEQLTKAMGGSMHSMDIVRGSFDFIFISDFIDLILVMIAIKEFISSGPLSLALTFKFLSQFSIINGFFLFFKFCQISSVINGINGWREIKMESRI